MNIMQIKYAVEVAHYGSINKAAEALYIAQPNLSRYIRELEADLGITIFKRTYRGMEPTPDGVTFLHYARQVLNQIDDIEKLYKGENVRKQRFSISVPRASYIADAFVQFSRHIDVEPTEIYYMETNTRKAIQNLLEADYRLGIIRYAAEDDNYFRRMLDEKGIVCQLVTDFTYVLIMSETRSEQSTSRRTKRGTWFVQTERNSGLRTGEQSKGTCMAGRKKSMNARIAAAVPMRGNVKRPTAIAPFS